MIADFEKEYAPTKKSGHLRSGKSDLHIVTGEGDPRNISLNSRAQQVVNKQRLE